MPLGRACRRVLLWDTAEPYRYLRVDRLPKYDFVIFGGEDNKTGQQADPKGCLETMLASILPQAKVHYRWSGQVVETNDGLPLMGETAPHQFAATVALATAGREARPLASHHIAAARGIPDHF